MSDLLEPLTVLDGVAVAVEQARDAVAEVYRHPANRHGWVTTAAEASLRAGRASGALEGAAVSLGTTGDVRDPILAGALRVAGRLHGEALEHAAAVWKRSPLQELAQLHVQVAARDEMDAEARERLGRPRPGEDVVPRLQVVAEVVIGADRAPAPLVAAIIHGELAALKPFGSMDGVVARAASRLVCASTGFDSRGLGVPEVLWNRQPARYRQLLGGFSAATPEGVGAWICYCCEAFVDGAREARAIADAAS